MIRKLAIGVAPLALLWSNAAWAGTPLWKVTEVSGPVQLKRADGVRAATRGVTLNPGDIVTTGAGARAVLVRGEEYVIVSPATQLRLPAVEKSGGIMQMFEDFGTAVYKIQKKMTPHFGVQTPYLAAVVKGTTFSVTVGPEGSSVQVIEGRVEVATNDGGARHLIEPGIVALVGASNLYRLTVDGDTKRVIDSPLAPVAADAAPGGTAPSGTVTPYSGPVVQPMVVASVAEPGRQFADLTGGLVRGDSGMEIAMAITAAVRDDKPAASNAPEGATPVAAGRPGAAPVKDADAKKADAKKADDKRAKDDEDARLKADQDARKKADDDKRAKDDDDVRIKADEDARKKADDDKRAKDDTDARLKADENARKKADDDKRAKDDEDARLKADTDARKKADDDKRLRADEDARKKADDDKRARDNEDARLKAVDDARKQAEDAKRVQDEADARSKADDARKAIDDDDDDRGGKSRDGIDRRDDDDDGEDSDDRKGKGGGDHDKDSADPDD